jgi:NADPH-dependent curcumin reductase CurA
MKILIFSELPQLGLTVAGTAGTIEGMELVKRVGADHVFNHREKGYLNNAVAAIGGHGFNVVLENLANVNLGADLTVLNQQARVAVSYIVGFHFKKQICPLERLGFRFCRIRMHNFMRAHTLCVRKQLQECREYLIFVGCILLRNVHVRIFQTYTRNRN